MIVSFGDKETEAVFHGTPVRLIRRFPADVLARAVRKLDMLNGAPKLSDLEVPPGNKLEALKRDLKGFHSIRVNEQWRIVFRWQGSNAHDVRLMDYH
ncbi:MAG: type II toxin-antitoxin system RelE/ParE family toxin [bacterium]|nr:type II toxin-antitoxin system RelE/ParE family toxin [bacterium]